MTPAKFAAAMTDRTKLRRLAEQATPGPWDVFHPERDCFDPATGHYTAPIGPHVVMQSGDAPWQTAVIGGENDEANAAYMAAMHPKTTLALLDQLARYKSLVAQGMTMLEGMHPATGMPDGDVARLYNAMMEALGDEQGC